MISTMSDVMCTVLYLLSFFFNATATTEIYTYGHPLSLPDALPICAGGRGNSIGRAYAIGLAQAGASVVVADLSGDGAQRVSDEISADRKSTRLNSSH